VVIQEVYGGVAKKVDELATMMAGEMAGEMVTKKGGGKATTMAGETVKKKVGGTAGGMAKKKAADAMVNEKATKTTGGKAGEMAKKKAGEMGTEKAGGTVKKKVGDMAGAMVTKKAGGKAGEMARKRQDEKWTRMEGATVKGKAVAMAGEMAKKKADDTVKEKGDGKPTETAGGMLKKKADEMQDEMVIKNRGGKADEMATEMGEEMAKRKVDDEMAKKKAGMQGGKERGKADEKATRKVDGLTKEMVGAVKENWREKEAVKADTRGKAREKVGKMVERKEAEKEERWIWKEEDMEGKAERKMAREAGGNLEEIQQQSAEVKSRMVLMEEKADHLEAAEDKRKAEENWVATRTAMDKRLVAPAAQMERTKEMLLAAACSLRLKGDTAYQLQD
jgi:hypothetical protein